MNRAEKREATRTNLKKLLHLSGYRTWRRFRDDIGAKHRLSLADRILLVRSVLAQVMERGNNAG
jgi:head-tail adaptor